jgi:hypothetical protein
MHSRPSHTLLEPELLESVPPEIRREVNQFTAIIGGFANAGQSPLVKKINEQHIDKLIQLSENESQREFQSAQADKKYNLLYVLIFCLVFTFLVVFLSDKNPELLKDLLKVLAGFIGGFGSAYGLKALKEKKED